jgi:hypothetical protein
MSQTAPTGRFPILRQAARAALQWRLLLLWIVVVWIPTGLLALPLLGALVAQLDYSVHAAEWAKAVNVVMLADLMEQLSAGAGAVTGSAIAAAIALIVGIPFLNAMFAGASRSDRSLRLGQLLHAGLTDYGPMLRLMLVALVPLGIALGLGALLIKGAHKYAERAILESDARLATWLAYGVAALLVAYAHAGVDAGRAWLAFEPRKRSAVKAWWRGARLVTLHPWQSLGLYLTITLGAGLALAVLSVLRLELAGGGVWRFLAGLLIVQVFAAVTAWMHYARLFALLELTRVHAKRADIAPVRRPEPVEVREASYSVSGA